jgi:hypothetical protein
MRIAYVKAFGRVVPPDARIANKRAVRITVKIKQSDSALKPWLPWARKRIDAQWLKALNESGGQKARTWFLCFRTIRPEEFAAVDLLDGEGG